MSREQLESQTIPFCRSTAQESIELFVRLLGAQLPDHLRGDRALLSVVRAVYKEVSGPITDDRCGERLEALITEANRRCAEVSYPLLAEVAVMLHRKDYLASMVVQRVEHLLPRRSDLQSCERLRHQFDPKMMPREFVSALLYVLPKMVGESYLGEIRDRCGIVADRYRFVGTDLLDWRGFFADPDLGDLCEALFEHMRRVFVSEKGCTYLQRHMQTRYVALGMERPFGDGDMRQLERLLRPVKSK